MSIFTTYQKNVSISCDNCDETFVETKGLINPIDQDSDGVDSFDNKEDAEDYARRNGWKIEGSKHSCPDCLNN